MDPGQYGPFTNIVTIAAALVAVFSVLLLKTMGRMRRWTWLVDSSPPFIIKVPIQVLSIAFMAFVYITISKDNYFWYTAVALICAVAFVALIYQFDQKRRIHVLSIPEVAPNGSQLLDSKKEKVFRQVIIGTVETMNSQAKTAFSIAQQSGPLTLVKFMSGYGSPPNDPEVLWDRVCLAKLGSKMSLYLMLIGILGVITLFLASIIIDVSTSQPSSMN